MKLTDKFKAKKTENQENPVNGSFKERKETSEAEDQGFQC